MKIYTVPSGILQANSYIITVDGKNGVVIDACGIESLQFAQSKGIKIKYVLLTHCHFDHISACAQFQACGAQIGVCQNEKHNLEVYNLAAQSGVELQPFTVDFTFTDGQILTLCGIEFRVILTEGHTSGSVCLVCEKNIFSGDTLFFESVGRTDLPTGSSSALIRSIKQKLFTLDGDYKVLSGHGEPTTIEHEKEFNPFII